jgi:pentalenolactone synthase
MNRVFSPVKLEKLTPTIERVARRLAGELADLRPPVNLNEHFSTPLTSEIMCVLLDMPTEDIGLYRGWTEEGARNTDIARSMVGIRRLTAYAAEVVSRRRAQPGDDAVSDLLRARDGEAEKIHEGKVVKLVGGMLAFGRETPASVIDWGAMLLLTHPDQIELLRADPARRTGAVEEVLRRFKPPAATERGLLRYAHTDIELGDLTIGAGDMVLLDVMAANHDPDVFPEPERFDITRDPNPQMTFGYGFYMCNFTRLARAEIGVALSTLAEFQPGLRLATPATELEVKDHLRTGGLAELPVTW